MIVRDSNSISTCPIYKICFHIYLPNNPGYGPPGLGIQAEWADSWLALPVPFLRVHDVWYPRYQISSTTPDCLASELYPNEPDLPNLAKLSSPLPDLKLIRRVLPDSGRVLNDPGRVSSSPLKTRIGAPSRGTY
jgi:hypothetical protein